MEKKESHSFAYDVGAAMRNAPAILGMELRKNGTQLVGQYYITGEPHPFRRDKIKVFPWKGRVFVQEEGGPCLSLENWLEEYGGAADYKEALRMINGQSQALHWSGETRAHEVMVQKFVPKEAVVGAANYDLKKCNLFNWMCSMFPEEDVRRVWKEYNVTTDSHGNCVYWYTDKDGKVLFDKRILYADNGHRRKDFFPGRQYRVADGYSGHCLFGDNLPDDGKKVFICESEKSALLGRLYFGRKFLATGGKSNLREVGDNAILMPDIDGISEWSGKGTVWPWWEKYGLPMEQIPAHADIGDYIVYKKTGVL